MVPNRLYPYTMQMRPDYEAVGFPIPYRPPAQFVVPPVRGYVLAPAVQPGLYPHPYLPTQAMIPFGAPLPIMHQ
ncbi:uncharacterized protein EI90DRAFT_3047054 [Cantharellus anzutake]|uniref:uncharacterized protein n=1 Tax=Cantharellus anzutake TaxID=1750568 RepID=UPI0019032873|nr:uncharacterized protein EI90DRAFT_3047054 [Cantharellus anzutake]KAF8335760.1 hypothetical protein EI90DRAFT_3047054 [Cantharellus anzutake]